MKHIWTLPHPQMATISLRFDVHYPKAFLWLLIEGKSSGPGCCYCLCSDSSVNTFWLSRTNSIQLCAPVSSSLFTLHFILNVFISPVDPSQTVWGYFVVAFFFKLALRLCRRSRIILIIWISWETNFYQLAFSLWHVEETGMLTLIRIISEAEEMFEQRQYSQTNKLKIYLRTEELVLRIKRLSHKHVSILESWKSKLGVASDYNPSTPEVDTGISWESWLARLPKIF